MAGFYTALIDPAPTIHWPALSPPCTDRITSPHHNVTVNITDWSQTAETKATWSWWSVWNLDQLRSFASVTMMANNFQNSVFHALAAVKDPNIIWQEIDTPAWKAFTPRSMEINYFAEGHRAGSTFFASDQGAEYLAQISRYLAGTKAEKHIWMANAKLSIDLPGERLQPRQAGSNKWSAMTTATMMFTAKPSGDEVAVAKSIGLDANALSQEREIETMIQFVARTAVRDPDSSETITVNVYDSYQADQLRAYFSKMCHITVTTNLMDLGFGHDERLRRAATVVDCTPEEIARRKLASNEKTRIRVADYRARKAKETPPAPVGRPRKIVIGLTLERVS